MEKVSGLGVKKSQDGKMLIDKDGKLYATYDENIEGFLRPRDRNKRAFGDCHRLVCHLVEQEDGTFERVCEVVFYDCPEA
jgi:hypothetical protein